MSGLPRSPATVEKRIRVSVVRAGLEDGRLGELADVGGDLEVAECAASLGVGLALGNPLPVEVRHLLNQVVVLQQDGPVRPDRQRVLVAGYRDSRIRRRRTHVMARHDRPLTRVSAPRL